MTIARTHTRTHVYITFADPYLQCDHCHQWVTSWHDDHRCGCGEGSWNMPCEHKPGVTSACPSWSPVDGCRCLEHLGRKDHDEPPSAGGAS